MKVDYFKKILDSSETINNYNIFYELYKIISSTLNLKELLNLAMEMSLNVVNAEVGTLFLFNKDNNEFYVAVDRGISKMVCSNIIYNKSNLYETFYKIKNEPVIIKNFKINIDKVFIKSLLIAPLLSKKNKLGIIVLANKSSGTEIIDFNNEDLYKIELLIIPLSVAIENSLLYNEMVEIKNFNLGIINSLNTAVLTLDLNRHITFINKSAEFVFNIDESYIGKNIEEILQNIEKDKEKIILEALKRNENLLNLKTSIKPVSGDEKILNFTISNLKDINGNIIGFVIAVDDITEQKILENQLIRSEQLAALGEISAGIAHELKNPLTSIMGFTQLLPQRLENKEFLLKYAQIIKEETNRLNKIIENLLQFARPKLKVKDRFNLKDVILRTIELLRYQLEKNNIKLELNLIDMPDIYGEFDKIEQVFINIIMNSIEAMPAGGKISIRNKTVVKRSSNNLFYEYAVVYFTDTGEGIKPEHIDKLFNPFFTTKPKGTGLGLSISHRIITEHSGTIEVFSKYGEGATFVVSLPTINN